MRPGIVGDKAPEESLSKDGARPGVADRGTPGDKAPEESAKEGPWPGVAGRMIRLDTPLASLLRGESLTPRGDPMRDLVCPGLLANDVEREDGWIEGPLPNRIDVNSPRTSAGLTAVFMACLRSTLAFIGVFSSP